MRSAFRQHRPGTLWIFRFPFACHAIKAPNHPVASSFPAPERTNDVQYDKINRRIDAAGDGYVAVVQQTSSDRHEEIGAKTALLVPELNRYYVAVAPGPGNFGGALLGFKVIPGGIAAGK